jgi:hypothetical protein
MSCAQTQKFGCENGEAAINWTEINQKNDLFHQEILAVSQLGTCQLCLPPFLLRLSVQEMLLCKYLD